MNAYDLGGHWTHVAPSGSHTDAILMGSALTVRTSANDCVRGSANGNALSGSVETGLPIPLAQNLTLAPQAQLVWQWTSLNSFNDGASDVSWNHGRGALGLVML